MFIFPGHEFFDKPKALNIYIYGFVNPVIVAMCAKSGDVLVRLNMYIIYTDEISYDLQSVHNSNYIYSVAIRRMYAS